MVNKWQTLINIQQIDGKGMVIDSKTMDNIGKTYGKYNIWQIDGKNIENKRQIDGIHMYLVKKMVHIWHKHS